MSGNQIHFKCNGWSGVTTAEFLQWTEVLDDLASAGTVVVDRSDRMVRRLELDGKALYAKWLYPASGLLQFIKRLFRRPRALAIWNIHHELRAAGIGCPTAVLAAVNSGHTGLFIASEVTASPCSKLLKETPPKGRRALMQRVAEAIAKLHNVGFIHGDCIPGNVCLGKQGEAAFIDNDRTRRSCLNCSRRRNLLQFCAHLPYTDDVADELVAVFLQTYSAAVKGAPELEAFLPRVRSRREEIARQRQQGIK